MRYVSLHAGTHHRRPLPFLFETNGAMTYFANGLDPVPRSRQVFNHPRPETLVECLGQSLSCARLKNLPALDEAGSSTHAILE
jgi:type I restriction enzyme R subunit